MRGGDGEGIGGEEGEGRGEEGGEEGEGGVGGGGRGLSKFGIWLQKCFGLNLLKLSLSAV